MSLKSDGNFELIFKSESEFEIICESKGQVLVILDRLKKSDYTSEVVHFNELDKTYPDLIKGKTTDQEKLIEVLQEWHDDLASHKVSPYQSF